jgi:hypothetical protein
MAPPVALVCVAAAPVASDATKSVATEAIETEAVKSEADVVDGSPSLRAASRKRERNSDDGRCRLGVRLVAYSDSDDEEGWDSS